MRRDLILIIFVVLIMGLLFALAKQGSRRVEAAPRPAATFTPTPIPPTAPTPVAAVDAMAPHDDEVARILDLAERLLEMTEAILRSDELEAQGPPVGTAVGLEPVTVAPTAMPALSVWEDGTCWTPADMQVLHLCGAAAGDGYVVRWVGVDGDSRGPEIADADWLAVRGGGDRVVWAGSHPGTGEAVRLTYWASGHVLAVHVGGRLLFRIDRNHNTK